MAVKIAINGYGRIGSNVLRAIYEQNKTSDIKVVAINSLGPVKDTVHMTKYDSVHGRFNCDIKASGDDKLIVNGDEIRYTSHRDPKDCKWGDLGVDIVFECTGIFRSKATAQAHIDAGAKKVLISAPGGSDVDATIVYGVNEGILKASDTVVSNASCTTNCLAPVAKILEDSIGIESGLMTTIHAYTSDQCLIDGVHSDPRRARSAAISMIPTKPGAAEAVGLVLPNLAGKFDGFAVRVPTQNVSVVDLTFVANRETTAEEVNELIKKAANGNDSLAYVLGYNEEPLVSIDFNHNSNSSTFDSTQTRVINGNLVKILSWYDNEWGFSNRMLDTAIAMMKA